MPRVVVCASHVPFVRGGAEILVESLVDELVRRGFETEVVALPFSWTPRLQLLRTGLAWRMVDLEQANGKPIDLVIATKFPSYFVRHPNKVVWLIHQFRQVYDLLGTEFSDFGDGAEDRATAEMLHTMDGRTLAEARELFSISRNTAERLQRFNGLRATPLYPPPRLGARHHEGPFGDYVLAVGRLDRLKRFDLLVRALPHTRSPARCVLAGTGPERDRLLALAAELGVADRVELAGWIDDDRLVELYANARGVFYAPYDEDYGYVTVEAFLSGKPMLTTRDAGGVLEFVADEENGYVVAPDAPRQLAAAIDRLFESPERAATLGRNGRDRVRDVTWDRVIERLTATI